MKWRGVVCGFRRYTFYCRQSHASVLAAHSACHFASSCASTPLAADSTVLMRQLIAKIRLKGPITVAEYMREVLTNSVCGYYMHKDVFGRAGDFTTSPEISQMFGELVGVWCVSEWMRSGSPNQLNVVELGPGRGTLADDMLRVFSKFPDLQKAVSLHLVEISPQLSKMQWEKLTRCHKPTEENQKLKGSSNSESQNLCYDSCLSHHGINVHWHKQLKDVPRGPMFLVAHEFFDALPIHKFQKQNGRWCEVLVDFDESGNCLRFVLSPMQTAALSVLFKNLDHDSREHIELCPEGAIVVGEIAERIEQDGGFGLLIDYGHTGEKTDTFRAFKKHALHDPLLEPGSADLTADVDFSYLKRNIHSQVSTFGPITQEKFLHNMGIGTRLQILLSNADNAQRKSLISGYDMLTNPMKMGDRFKFFAILQKLNSDHIPAGFTALT